MATGTDLRRIALNLPHATEKPHFDRTSFRVDAPKGKIFATMIEDGTTANLMLSRDEQDLLCAAEPDVFTPVPNKWGEKGATTITLAVADQATLKSALTMAWKKAAPEKLWPLLEA
ncbi:MAG: MmcQ/YjbR family DNA-binding protein [Pseudomonadota bacterium]